MDGCCRAALAAAIISVWANPCWAQRGIPIFRPPVRVPVRVPHVPVHLPFSHGGSSHGGANVDGGGWEVNPWLIFAWIAGSVGVVGGTTYVVRRWKKRAVSFIRIVKLPPGEAPEEIRRAWIGLELPLCPEERETKRLQTVGVLTHQDPREDVGFAVDGRKAIEALANAWPDVAAWWREHAPHVLKPGYRLMFPHDVCERMA